jgi:hypothetical protein
MKNLFYWCGVSIFDSRQKQYGGFNHFIAGKIFRWKYNYLDICLRRMWKFEIKHEEKGGLYYDGWHNCINIGILQISYGTL